MNTTPDANSESASNPTALGKSPVFVTTRWSVVLAAGHDDTDSQRALEQLCQTYWYPLYAYVRRRGYSPPDAQDLTQEFFTRLLQRNWITQADRKRGRFRSLLLSAMNNFLADEWDKARAQKRGGGMHHLPLQFDTAETRYGYEPSDRVTPDQIYERRWALTLLEDVLVRLRQQYEREVNSKLFESLHPCLVGQKTAQPYAELARQLQMTETAIKTAVHRLRGRYREMLRNEIAQTVASHSDVDDELNHLFDILARS